MGEKKRGGLEGEGISHMTQKTAQRTAKKPYIE